jgi:hypothetical protein
MNGTVALVGREGVDKRLRSQAHWIYVESAIAALILTLLSFYFAVVLPGALRSSEGLTLEQAADFLIRHGYAVLFGWVLLEQMGLPIPAAPLLIAARCARPCRQDEFDVRGDLGIHRGYFG